MVTCERCGTENLDGSQYCDECGVQLPGVAVRNQAVPAGESEPPRERPKTAFEQANGPLEAVAEAKPAVAPEPLAKSVEGVHASLIIERGRSAGKQFPLSDEESQIGRWDADGGIFPDVDLDADDPEAKVSRRHARIMRRNGQYLIEDLGSTNGTFINRGRRLLPGDRQQLRDGDEIIVGKTFLRFRVVNRA
jgi:pSer/pThr/pTyr-binding forkhead associated (FHA) protein